MGYYARLQSDRRVILLVWMAIFAMKLLIGISHVLAARRSSLAPPDFGLTAVEYHGTDSAADRAFGEYSRSITRTIDEFQRLSQRQHLLASYGYFAAALTSLVSIYLELRSLAGRGR